MSHRLVACEHCDYLHVEDDIPPGFVARCARCGAPLYQAQKGTVERPLAFAITALVLFLIANAFPILTFAMEGRTESNTLISGVVTFWQEGFPFLAFMVAVTSIVAPFLLIGAYIYVLAPLRFGFAVPGLRPVWRILSAVRPWSMLDVFLIGLLVALTKLTDFADVLAGPAFYAVCALIPSTLLMSTTLDPRTIWRRLEPENLHHTTVEELEKLRRAKADGGKVTGWMTCETCAFVATDRAAAEHDGKCPRCGTHMHHRKAGSLSRAFALLVAAMVLYIPANIFPIMTITYLGRAESDTIVSGVAALMQSGEWPIAIVVFTASIAVPIIKIVLLGWVYTATWFGKIGSLRQRTSIYRITELIGRWSMVDVFMVSILAALVKLGNIATVAPGFGAVAFCAVVILTMLSAMAFDPRLIWDRAGMQKEQGMSS
tara:strand:- start:76488 stop:77777 length:1290 start_codon:yes stop_codon:yes gene_type:complete